MDKHWQQHCASEVDLAICSSELCHTLSSSCSVLKDMTSEPMIAAQVSNVMTLRTTGVVSP